MERASSAAISKPKIVPVVLFSTIPLKLLSADSSKIEERNGKVNTRHNRKRPYEHDEADNECSLSNERTSCSNCNKQTNNQSSFVSSTSGGGGDSGKKKEAKTAISSMIQSPMLILPIVTSAPNKSTQVNVFCSQQQQQQKQQQLHHPVVYFAAKKAVDESNGCNGGSNALCGVREISCSFQHTNYNFLSRRRLLTLFLALLPSLLLCRFLVLHPFST
jgi:hypothetical protein